MNDQDTTTPYTPLIVVGASGRIGREVARLGVAYGTDVIGVSRTGVAPLDEPWVHGVQWLACDASDVDALLELPRGALVIAAPIAVPPELVSHFDRVVVVRAGGVSAQTAAGAIVATPRDVDDSPIDDSFVAAEVGTIRVERLGMALLRAALDEGIPPLLDHDALERLGDAVMLQ